MRVWNLFPSASLWFHVHGLNFMWKSVSHKSAVFVHWGLSFCLMTVSQTNELGSHFYIRTDFFLHDLSDIKHCLEAHNGLKTLADTTRWHWFRGRETIGNWIYSSKKNGSVHNNIFHCYGYFKFSYCIPFLWPTTEYRLKPRCSWASILNKIYLKHHRSKFISRRSCW